jgi:glycosyltransferase involved in cell wall biosynthesis
VTRLDLENLATLSGFSIVRQRPCAYFPWRVLGLGDVVNSLLPIVPLLRWLSLTYVLILRPRPAPRPRPGLTCVIPARNERGNIEDALRRFPELHCPVEIIFVEGHSTDGTWEEIRRVASAFQSRFAIRALQQTGQGKADAVRLGFDHATQPVLTILDADLTMPPEMLGRFYEAYCEGHADFINGSRLVYPMEGEAMRFMNRLGNVAFAKALSWVLDTRLSDSLCGTKLLRRSDYLRMTAWRKEFGAFDPFGDFELLFPAAVLGLGTIDVPVRYLARRYGSTSIRRFRHGWDLLRMTWIGFLRIKIGSRQRRRQVD